MNDPSFWFDVLIAFNLGLASQVHCAGMCGGVVAALSFAVPPATPRRRLLGIALCYNLGRALSYASAGAIFGALLAQAVPGIGHYWLRLLAGLVLVASGLSLAGLLPRMHLLETWGMRLWRRVQPFGRRLLPVDNWRKALAFGGLWGLLPCALVYSTLLFAATHAVAWQAGLIMLAFGLGTSPALVGGVWLAARVPARLKQAHWRKLAGAVVVIVGIAYLFLEAPGHGAHAGGLDHGDSP